MSAVVSPIARDSAISALSALLALGVVAAGGLGMRDRASARVQTLDRRMSERLDGMERRQSALHADVAHRMRARTAAAAPGDAAINANAVAADASLEAAQPIAAEVAAAPSHPLLGDWRCSFRQQEHSYPPMPCRITRKDGGFVLEKTHGSQRIKGTVTLQGDDRFVFNGLYFCPFGSCDERVSGSFQRKSRDHWVGQLSDGGFGTVVTLRRPTAAASASTTKSASAPAPTSTTRSAADRPKTRAAVPLLDPF